MWSVLLIFFSLSSVSMSLVLAAPCFLSLLYFLYYSCQTRGPPWAGPGPGPGPDEGPQASSGLGSHQYSPPLSFFHSWGGLWLVFFWTCVTPVRVFLRIPSSGVASIPSWDPTRICLVAGSLSLPRARVGGIASGPGIWAGAPFHGRSGFSRMMVLPSVIHLC